MHTVEHAFICYPLFSRNETCISHGDVYQIKMEILGLKKGGATLLYVLDMVGSTRKCWLVVEGMEGQFIVTHGYWTHSQGDGRR